MENMLIVALMVVSCVLINPFLSANDANKVAAVTEQTQSDDENEGESEEDDEEEDEEEPAN
jgi:hypothetical protein